MNQPPKNQEPHLIGRWCRCAGVLALLVGVAGLSGCGGSGAQLGTVHGKVTLDGKPLVHAAVSFSPEPQGTGRTSYAVTDAQGNYELHYLRDMMGAKVGEHTVRISTANEHAHRPDSVLACYNKSSTLKRKVVAGDNVFNFDLKTTS
jgi:hypothetical protein